jgi:SAM-dependent methyltransferase
VQECPVCGSRIVRTEVPADLVRSEIRMRSDFVFSRVPRNAPREELKDLTDFMHGFAAPLVSCATCGTLLRDEQDTRQAHDYEEDPNDTDLMRQVLPRYVTAFRNKRVAYEPLIRQHADVLELGSHLGAFLQVAEEWNWQPVALDVGRDTAAFARANGFKVRQELVEQSGLPTRAFDAVFIWNCFDQIPHPEATLAGVYRVLKPNGLLIIRVPNAVFYRALRNRLQSRFALRALAYNNLLGFPYLYGYTAESLNRLLLRRGFQELSAYNSELVTMPFADPTTKIATEQAKVSAAVARWSTKTTAATGHLTGPWIELVYRKMTEADWKRTAGPAKPKIDLRFLERAA